MADLMELSELLFESCRAQEEIITEKSKLKSVLPPTSGDDLCSWWANLLTCGVYWAAGDVSSAQEKYMNVRRIPQELLTENLALALGHAFCAQKLCLENRNQKYYEQLVWIHCCKARQSLKLLCKRDRSSPVVEHLENSVQLVVFDWLFSSLMEIWKGRIPPGKHYWLHSSVAPLSQLFQQLLHYYRQLTAPSYDWLKTKVLLYEAVERMLSGANPVPTWQMLRKCSRVAKDGGDILSEQDQRRLTELLKLHQALSKY